ncbi:MAG: WbqC family protein [Alistipes sp.]|nr:WbqC family protein [Alistipes sp.]
MGEHWVKQTFRNRAEILTANGVATLTVPVHGYGAKIATRDVRIDNSRRWQHVHWMSIASAYRAAPFFEHYEERFAGVYGRRFEFLVDLNLELTAILAHLFLVDAEAVEVSRDYVVAAPGDIDLRGKKAFRRADLVAGSKEYIQVFYDRVPFVPGLSAVDLLFCEGPAASQFVC